MKPASAELRIGLYGGSFDPIHIGHLSLALEMLEAHRLDAVWLCPAYLNPQRQQIGPQAATHHRCAMIRAAIGAIASLKLSTVEIERPLPSYTVDTLRLLTAAAERRHRHRHVHFFLILGADSAATFLDWQQPAEIIKLATPLVGQRLMTDQPAWYLTDPSPIAAALRAGCTPTRQIDVSSSEVRLRLATKMHVEHLLPRSVWRYIQRHNLYT